MDNQLEGDFAWFVNQEFCPTHKLFYHQKCGPCSRETYEAEQRKKLTVFRYRVVAITGWSAFEQEVMEAGREGMEYLGHSSEPDMDALRKGEDLRIYTVVFRVHRPD